MLGLLSGGLFIELSLFQRVMHDISVEYNSRVTNDKKPDFAIEGGLSLEPAPAGGIMIARGERLGGAATRRRRTEAPCNEEKNGEPALVRAA